MLEERTARMRGLEDHTRCPGQHHTSRQPASGLSWHRRAHESTSDLSPYPWPVQRSIRVAADADVVAAQNGLPSITRSAVQEVLHVRRLHTDADPDVRPSGRDPSALRWSRSTALTAPR